MTYTLTEEAVSHPGSPPDLSHASSKSSKTSSFHSAYHSDDNADLNNFEEIGLDDEPHVPSGDFGIKSTATLPVMGSFNNAYATDLRTRTLAGKKSMPSLSPQMKHRELTGAPGSRQSPPRFPMPRSTTTADLAPRPMVMRSNSSGPPQIRRGASSPGPLAPSRSSERYQRSRTPSPNTLVPSSNFRARSTSANSLPRATGWQLTKDRARKSTVELELECDEDDDDSVPDGCFLDNVPMSPRPPGMRTPSFSNSKEPSPERPRLKRDGPKKEKMKAVGNGTPPTAVAQGCLKSPLTSPGVPQPGAISMSQFPLNGDNGKTIPRPRSWDDAMSHLSPETQALTEKLEEHATELEKLPSSPQHRRSLNVASTRPKAEPKQRIKSTPELPPLRRTNIMIDPLPISKEKEAVLSRTRPSWLPPKDPAEERRHVKEYQRIMAMSAVAAKKKEDYIAAKVTYKEDTTGALGRIWEEIVIPDWDKTMRHKRTRELWWRGIGPRSRGKVWMRAIGNELGLSEGSFRAALSRAKDMEKRINSLASRAEKDGKDVHETAGFSPEELRMKDGFERIAKDMDVTYPELGLFRGIGAGMEGPLRESLRDVLYAYSAYRGDVGYIPGTNMIAAILLLNLPSPADAFTSLCNLLNRPLPLSFHTGDHGAMERVYSLTMSTLSTKYPRLHDHFIVCGLSPESFLEPVFRSLFTQQLPLEETTRLWDVFVFEGDSILVRAAVALLGSLETQLTGIRDRYTLLSIIGRGLRNEGANTNPISLDSDEWIKRLREAGREGAAQV